MKKSLLKLSLLFLLIFALGLQIAAESISFSLARYPRALQILLQRATGAEVSFSRVSYGLRRGLSFEGFILKKDGESLAYFKTVQLGIAWLPLIRRQLWLSRIVIREGWVSPDISKHKSFFLSGFSAGFTKLGIKTEGNLAPARKRLSVVVRGVKIYLAGNKKREFLVLDSQFVFNRENLFCVADLDFGNTRLRQAIFRRRINLRAQLAIMGKDLLINNIVAANGDIRIAGAGIIYNFLRDPKVDIRIISVPLNLRELVNYKTRALMSGTLNIAANLKSDKTGISLSGEMMMGKGEVYFPKQTVRLSSLFIQANLKDNRLEIKDLTALINSKYPFSLHGYIADFTRPRFNLTLGSFKTNRAKDALEDSVLVNLNLDGRFEDLNLRSNVAMRYTQRKQYPHYLIQRTIDLEINDLRFMSEGKGAAGTGGRFSLAADRLGLSYRKIIGLKSRLNQRLQLNGLLLNLSLNRQDRFAAALNAEAYGGRIEGLGRWGLEGMRPGDFFLLRFRGLRAEAMQEVIPENIQLAGELNGILHLLNQNGLELGGAFTVSKGSISRFIILDNIADFLGIKSLKDLNAVTLSADFLWSGSQFCIRRLKLSNPIAAMSSALALNQNQWASGTANLVLQRRVLEESDILRRLLSIAGEVSDRVEFEFRISGFPQAIRVELQESKFRDRLVEKLSGSIRARIENEINKAMDAFRGRQ